MNAVEIEEAISRLAEQPFDAAEFPYAFLEAFGNKPATLSRLKSGNANKTDIEGGILQPKMIHMAVSPAGAVLKTLDKLRNSPATAKQRAKFILATDGEEFQAEDLTSDSPPLVCKYSDFPNHFGFFLPLAGISTVKQISENAFDIRATSRLNRLYVELLKDNPEWGTEKRRPEMNHFMARLIFCFFAEDTDIFNGAGLFTETVEQMSAKDSSNTHEVIGEIFRAMNTKVVDRTLAKLPRWADTFPYVNGGLFSGSTETPRFSKIARSYLLHVGNLDWTKINPDIFGSMIQAVADDEERGALGMHYTSVPNILKVLNPLFLDDLRVQLDAAGDSPQKLLNLRKRMARIRVFDPACGSGNFLVIAYKEMRAIEAEINIRRSEPNRRTEIPITNFRGIELRDFPAEIARLALIIAEYQCDVTYRGQKEALAEFLPLDAQNWITCGNSLRLDWLSICPPTGKGVKLHGDDLFNTPLDQAQIDFENEGGETYICGNPPYLGSQGQSLEQKSDLQSIFEGRTNNWKSLDYVAGWFMKATDYSMHTPTASAFVSTNSICQGRQVATLWPLIFRAKHEIFFAYNSFKWSNLASNKAGVSVVIIGISNTVRSIKRFYSSNDDGTTLLKEVTTLNAYLVPAADIIVNQEQAPLSVLPEMSFGNMPNDGGGLLLELSECDALSPSARQYIRPFYGSQEFIRGIEKRCIWVSDADASIAQKDEWLSKRFDQVKATRNASSRPTTKNLAQIPHRFGEVRQSGDQPIIIVPSVSSENRQYLPVGLLPAGSIVSNLAFFINSADVWNVAIVASRMHHIWIATVCGTLGTSFRYSNTLGWNTFPVPQLTEKNQADLTRCAEDILLAREAHFPATIADLYDPDNMPENLSRAHERNDEVLERIYIGRRFKNDTERLEKLFDLYTKMTAEQKTVGSRKVKAK